VEKPDRGRIQAIRATGAGIGRRRAARSATGLAAPSNNSFSNNFPKDKRASMLFSRDLGAGERPPRSGKSEFPRAGATRLNGGMPRVSVSGGIRGCPGYRTNYGWPVLALGVLGASFFFVWSIQSSKYSW
jgi:hypothetical protein